MDTKKVHRFGAIFVFLFSFLVYFSTIAPTVSFWDCGEFIACSYRLAVPHPPGSPLFLLVGRIFTLLPIFEDIAKRVNFISVLASAFTVLFTYLTIVILIKQYMKNVRDGLMQYVPYIGGIIGSLTFAFTTSFWFNAVEAEVYASSMLFTSLVVWLILYWGEKSEEVGNERYLLVIMYLVGLAIGVHLLNVLALPTVFMIIYYRKYSVNTQTFFYMVIIGAMLTAMIYPGLVNGLPQIAEKAGFLGLLIFIVAILMALVYAVNNKKSVLSLVLTTVLLVVLGYSTYLTIYIRSNLDPTIDENDPENIERFISYLKREQYGQHTLDRAQVLRESPNGDRYTGVWDFFWRYQVNKMYVRYLLWNFLGEEGREGGVLWWKFFGIPFLLGLFGAYYHFKKDWKHALAVFVLFFMTGFAIILYLNQPDPQPRERDYSYVGSFFAFSLWIGIGAAALVEWFINFSKEKKLSSLVPISIALLLFLASPVQVMVKNYHSHDRTGNYVAWDYSYNMLQSCEPNGVIYTNGDNDTFPVWFLQKVENVRTDVRVANLSLLNTDWYILQLKHKEPRVPISLSDREINKIQPIPWPKKKTIEINVPGEYANKEWQRFKETYQFATVNSKPTQKMKFDVRPKLFGRYLRVQDYMILNTLYANKFRKPLYFAVTCSRDNMLDGLQRYLRMDGLAFKITTVPNWTMDPEILYDNLMNKYQYRNLNNPDVYYNKNIISLLQNYRSAFVQLANYYASVQDTARVKKIMQKLNTIMPPEVIPFTSSTIRNWVLAYNVYAGVTPVDSISLAKYGLRNLQSIAEILYRLQALSPARKLYEEILAANPQDYRAKGSLINIYGEQKEYQKAIDILEKWLKDNPNDKAARARLEEYKAKLASQGSDTAQALKSAGKKSSSTK